TVDLPSVARPRRVGHPQEPAAVLGPEMSLKALENGTVRDVVHELRLAFEVLETCARSILFRERRHEGGHIAVTAEMPIVVGVGIAQRPQVGGWYGRPQRLQRGQGGRA